MSTTETKENELLNQILKGGDATVKTGEYFSVGSHKILDAQDFDGIVNDTDTKEGVEYSAPRNSDNQTVEKGLDAEIRNTRASGSPRASKGFSAAGNSMMGDTASKLNGIMSYDSGNDDVTNVLKSKVAVYLMETDIVRSNMETLDMFQDLTQDARNQMISTPQLLRKSPYMTDLWHLSQSQRDSEEVVTQMFSGEGVITSVVTNEGEGGYSKLRTAKLPVTAVSPFNTVFRGVESEYSSLFENVAEGIESIPTLDDIKNGEPAVLAGNSIFSSKIAGNWNFDLSLLEKSGLPIASNLADNTTMSSGQSFGTYLSENKPTPIEPEPKAETSSSKVTQTAASGGGGGSVGSPVVAQMVTGGGSPIPLGSVSGGSAILGGGGGQIPLLNVPGGIGGATAQVSTGMGGSTLLGGAGVAAGTTGGVALPASGTFTSGFGPRWGTFHDGIDIAAPIGTPIYAVMDGVVVNSGPASGYGNWIQIKHDDGSLSEYGHMPANMLYVKVGERVTAGQHIAGMGSEGQSTGSHLHFEIKPDGSTSVDPVPWFAARGITI